MAAELQKEFKPLHNICEFLNALHVYADEARHGVVRHVEANHFCSHVRDGPSTCRPDGSPAVLTGVLTVLADLRQCLIYDSAAPDARLIGVEYMVPKRVYETFGADEQKLWHSHEFEVASGMLVLPKPESKGTAEWEQFELEAMKEVVGLYGKTWHFWQVDRGDQYPLGALPQSWTGVSPERRCD